MGIKQKAEYFICKFIDKVHQAGDIDKTTEQREYLNAVDCAIITVEEILKYVPMYTGNLNPACKELDDIREYLEQILTSAD